MAARAGRKAGGGFRADLRANEGSGLPHGQSQRTRSYGGVLTKWRTFVLSLGDTRRREFGAETWQDPDAGGLSFDCGAVWLDRRLLDVLATGAGMDAILRLL